MSHLDLFAVPLFRTIIDELTESEVNYLQTVPMTQGRHQAMNSENLHLLDQLELRTLRTHIDLGIKEYLTHLGVAVDEIEITITTSWLNRYQKGDLTHQHHHSNSIISGVYYPTACDHSAPIQFHRGHHWHNLWPNMINLPIRTHNALNIDRITVVPKQSELIMWPSHLEHSVPANQSHQPRETIAFNTFVKGTLNPGGGSELTI